MANALLKHGKAMFFYFTCHGTVSEAKRRWPNNRINGWYYCCNACHTSQPRMTIHSKRYHLAARFNPSVRSHQTAEI